MLAKPTLFTVWRSGGFKYFGFFYSYLRVEALSKQ